MDRDAVIIEVALNEAAGCRDAPLPFDASADTELVVFRV
jgi:hypothetical protein